MAIVSDNPRLDALIVAYDAMREKWGINNGDAVLFFTGGLVSVLEQARPDVADIMREDIAAALKRCDMVQMLKKYNQGAA